MLDGQCQPGLASPAVAGRGRGKSELMDINGCGFDGEGSGSGEGGREGKKREKPMEKMKRQRK